jgi:predicted N-acetyltransferase YhbS
MNKINIKLEQPSDFADVEKTTYEALRNASQASGKEALLAHKMRTIHAFVPELDFVAEISGNVVGNIMYTKSKITGETGEWETLTFGPVGVLPAYQRQGVGTALIEYSLSSARAMGFRAVLIFGHENYYPVSVSWTPPNTESRHREEKISRRSWRYLFMKGRWMASGGSLSAILYTRAWIRRNRMFSTLGFKFRTPTLCFPSHRSPI